LRERGVRLAIDDAGAGYSSLRHILQLRPDLIKLDMSLTRNICIDPARKALAAAMVNFARDTGSQIIAEGVETASEFATLRALGAEKAQGYFLGRPLPLEDAAALFRANTPDRLRA
jgi:EAL domain-containing protein (putative c-di-GMP-specific phosphodiesterase class I)